jgi:hypothetical protein
VIGATGQAVKARQPPLFKPAQTSEKKAFGKPKPTWINEDSIILQEPHLLKD